MTTITHEQFEAALKAICTLPDDDDSKSGALYAALTAAGITIAPTEPPKGMVKLAREIADRELTIRKFGQTTHDHVALAALQHAVQVVREQAGGARLVVVSDILRKLGDL